MYKALPILLNSAAEDRYNIVNKPMYWHSNMTVGKRCGPSLASFNRFNRQGRIRSRNESSKLNEPDTLIFVTLNE